jgi:RNA polymerase sigma-70 factor (ECF subfamily)
MDAGSTDGFDEFYAAAFGRLVGQLYFVTGDVHEAEDVVQEAMARAAVRWPQVREYDAPENWVRRVAMNLALDGLRRARRRVTVLLRLGPPEDVPPVSEDGVALVAAMRTLPARHRQVLVLHHLVGLSVEEIASQLAVPAGTVKTRLARGRRMLASRLDNTAEGVPAHHG